MSFSYLNLIMLLSGVILGLILNASRLKAAVGMSLLLPLCFVIKSDAVIIGLLAIYCAANLGRTYGAVAGAFVSLCLVALVMTWFASFASRFSSAEYIALAVFVMTSLISTKCWIGLMSLSLGLFIPTVGIDIATGLQRYTFGIEELHGGIDFVVVALGVCVLGEIFHILTEVPTVRAIRSVLPEEEAADSAREAGALLPAVAFGLPCTVETAILVGMFSLYGIRADFAAHFSVMPIVYAVILAAAIRAIFEKYQIKMKAIPTESLYPLFVTVAFCGAYSLNYRVLDMFLLLGFGLLGLLMRKFRVPLAPFFLGLVASTRLEQAFREPFALNWLSILLFVGAAAIIYPCIERQLRRQGTPSAGRE